MQIFWEPVPCYVPAKSLLLKGPPDTMTAPALSNSFIQPTGSLSALPLPSVPPLTFPEAVFLTLSLVLIIYPLNLSSVRAVFGWEPQPWASLTYWLRDFEQVTLTFLFLLCKKMMKILPSLAGLL